MSQLPPCDHDECGKTCCAHEALKAFVSAQPHFDARLLKAERELPEGHFNRIEVEVAAYYNMHRILFLEGVIAGAGQTKNPRAV